MLHQYQQAKLKQQLINNSNIPILNQINQMVYYPAHNQNMFVPFINNNQLYSMMGFPYSNNLQNMMEPERKRTYPSHLQNLSEKENPSNPKRKKLSSPSTSSNTTNNSNSSNSSIQQKKKFMFGNNVQIENRITEDKIEEFQNFLSTRKTSVVEYLCTQRGAKEIEKTLKKSPNECITILVNNINVYLTKVMTDVYGNYFCQKIIQASTPNQITLMLNFISKDFIQIAKDYSGTHVLQALLDVVSTQEQETIILNSIKGSELEIAYDNNATHVLQKIIQSIAEERRSSLNEIILGNIKQLSLNSNGICLVKKYIANNVIIQNKQKLINALTENCLEISQDPYGNYAIQYILDEWSQDDCSKVVNIIIENICSLSKQKFSSNVVEKIIELIDEERKQIIFNELFNEAKLNSLIKNKYGKYVIQKSVKSMNCQQKKNIIKILEKISASSTNIKEKKMLASLIECFEKKSLFFDEVI